MTAASPPLISKFSELAPNYDALLCDVWGVIHNGIVATPPACDALMRTRARGAVVVLITNAPRPNDIVARQLEKFHVPRETYDAIVSSGDVTRSVVEARRGQTVYHLGPERDAAIFRGLNVDSRRRKPPIMWFARGWRTMTPRRRKIIACALKRC